MQQMAMNTAPTTIPAMAPLDNPPLPPLSPAVDDGIGGIDGDDDDSDGVVDDTPVGAVDDVVNTGTDDDTAGEDETPDEDTFDDDDG